MKPAWACVNCHVELAPGADRSLVCERCGARYPIVGNAMPVLMDKPEPYLVKEAVSIEADSIELAAGAARFAERARLGGPRAALAERVSLGLEQNAAFSRSIAAEIVEALGRSDRARVRARLAVVRAKRAAKTVRRGLAAPQLQAEIGLLRYHLTYVRRDWAAGPIEEERVQRVEKLVFDLARERSEEGPALVLGAGAGRYARDLREVFRPVFAIDRSATFGMIHDRLMRGDVELADVADTSLYDTAGVVRPLVAHMPRDADTDSFAYAIADGLRVPLPDASLAAIVSIYFTDCLPPRPLLAEVKRLLRPGGAFIHFGPLAYRSDFSERASVEELRVILREEGFSLDERGFFEDRAATSPTMFASCYDCWLFSGRPGQP